MKVAVMMAAYNAERYIEAALGSLLRQRKDALLDIIVVNDGSTDGTSAIVRRLASEAPEIRLIEQANHGITRTRNILLDAIAPDTDLATTNDSDDLSPPGRFARDVKLLEADPAAQLVYGYMFVFRGEGDDPMSPDFVGRTAKVRGIHLGAMLARQSFLKTVGRFDEKFIQAEDTDYLFRALETQPRIALVDDVSYIYRRHETNISADLRIVRREFARALLAATRRRQTQKVPGVPPNFFDHGPMADDNSWY